METTEETIQRVGATKAPRITPADIEKSIAREYFFTALNGVAWSSIHQDAIDPGPELAQQLKMMTICVLVLENGFTVVGHAGVASPENYNIEVGKKVARSKAVDQLWPLLGYQLKQKLYEDGLRAKADLSND